MKYLNNIHPGEVLSEEFLEPMGISAYKLSKATGIPQTRISQIIKGKRRVTANTALRFSKYFGTSAKFWLGLQNDFDLEEEARTKSVELKSISNINSILEKYLVTANKLGWEIDLVLFYKVAGGIVASIKNRDDAYVATSDPKEMEAIKRNFVIKKLGIRDNETSTRVLVEVKNEFKGIRHKPKALFYYRLITSLNKEKLFA